MEASWLIKSPRVKGLEHIAPGDADFIIAQESEDPVYPPSFEEEEELRAKQKAWKKCYDQGENEEDIAVAQALSTVCGLLEVEVITKQKSFDHVKKCIDTATAAERMELGAKSVDVTKAGQWKLLRVKLQKRMKPFEAATAATAAAAAAAAADSRKRKNAAVAAAAAGGVEELDHSVRTAAAT
jgi:hypothetical protein